jgi:membrane protease YdiL (CAAX protease family)
LGAFSLAHLPFWGATSALFTLVAGAALTALYLWKRNLVVNMLAHALTAMVQLLTVART